MNSKNYGENTMVESFKYKSKMATAIGAVATIISILGVDQLQTMFPSFGQYIPIVVAAASWYLSQTTENTRVDIAEQLIREEYEDNASEQEENVVVNLTLDGEDIITEDEESVSEEENPDITDDDGGC